MKGVSFRKGKEHRGIILRIKGPRFYFLETGKSHHAHSSPSHGSLTIALAASWVGMVGSL